eukprot:1840729-Rhodomonas_salina.2
MGHSPIQTLETNSIQPLNQLYFLPLRCVLVGSARSDAAEAANHVDAVGSGGVTIFGHTVPGHPSLQQVRDAARVSCFGQVSAPNTAVYHEKETKACGRSIAATSREIELREARASTQFG